MKNKYKNIIYDPWFAQILQRDVYRLVVDDELIEKSREPALRESAGQVPTGQVYDLLRELQSKPLFMYAKVSTTSLFASQFLERVGFNLVDTNVIFNKPIAPRSKFAAHCAVRFAVSSDKSQVMEVARKNFVYSRFHLDRAIPNLLANKIKAEWVGNYFPTSLDYSVGKRGDEMVVAVVDERVVGFLQLLRRNEGQLIIDLIAVDASQRRKGIASDMIAYAESKCHGCERILVGTQVANIPSIRLYEKIGFRLCASKYVFHYHNLPLEEA